jgi:hypothetical protein
LMEKWRDAVAVKAKTAVFVALRVMLCNGRTVRDCSEWW